MMFRKSLLLSVIATALAIDAHSLRAQSTVLPSKVGIEAGGDYMFVDLVKTARAWGQDCSPTTTPADAQYWPTQDTCTVLFDNRPVAAWLGPSNIDDPAKYQPDWSGTYQMVLTGQADISITSDSGDAAIGNVEYDALTNTTLSQLTVSASTGLVVLTFANTRRTPDAATNTGFTGLRILRPGFGLDTDQVFTPEFLDTLGPFQVLRFMEITGTNNANPENYNLPEAQNSLSWTDRITSDDAIQQMYGDPGTRPGLAWEYVIQIANLTNKDIWINVPVAANDDYVTNLAELLQSTLHADANIYIEDSNEVWNSSFPQYTWNNTAAQQEVAAGNSPLNDDGTTDPDTWAQRRHAKRLIEIAKIFQNVFGTAELLTRIRPVYASWTLDPSDAYFGQVLAWVGKTYGPANQFFYGMAKTGYFGNDTDSAAETVDQLVAGYQSASNVTAQSETPGLKVIAAQYGLPLFAYEGGPGYDASGNTVNIANRVLAARDPRMQAIVFNHLATNWYPVGGDLFMYYSLIRPVSRYGNWGAIEDVHNPAKVLSPKYAALLQLTKAISTPGPATSVSAAYALIPAVAADALATAYGTAMAAAAAVAQAQPLPTRINQTSVAVTDSAGVTRLAPLLYISPTQVNYVVPDGSAPGAGSVTIYNGLGLPDTGTITIQNVAPALLSGDGSGTGPAAAQVIYADGTVEDVCTFDGHTCAAVPVDLTAHGGSPVLVLYGTGIRNHASVVTCQIGDLTEAVLYAGAQNEFAGLDQVNVMLPAQLAGTGDNAVTLSLDGSVSNPVHVVIQ